MAKKEETKKHVHSQEKVWVTGTEKSKYLDTGKDFELTITLAAHLVKTGHAIYKKDK